MQQQQPQQQPAAAVAAMSSLVGARAGARKRELKEPVHYLTLGVALFPRFLSDGSLRVSLGGNSPVANVRVSIPVFESH